MTPTTLAELFETPKRRITYSGDIYAINRQLSLAPWMPPVVEVWAEADTQLDLTPDKRRLYWEVRDMLTELHDEHLRRQQRGSTND